MLCGVDVTADRVARVKNHNHSRRWARQISDSGWSDGGRSPTGTGLRQGPVSYSGSGTACCRPRRLVTLARSGASTRRPDLAAGASSPSVANETPRWAGRLRTADPVNCIRRAAHRATIRTQNAPPIIRIRGSDAILRTPFRRRSLPRQATSSDRLRLSVTEVSPPRWLPPHRVERCIRPAR
jgi:hypothetical protein